MSIPTTTEPKPEVQQVTVTADTSGDLAALDLSEQNLKAEVAGIMEQIQPTLDQAQLILQNFEKDETGKYCESPEVQQVLSELQTARNIPYGICSAAQTAHNKAEKMRKKMKDPILTAGRNIDDLYNPRKVKCTTVKESAHKYLVSVDQMVTKITNASNAQAQALQEAAANEAAARMSAERSLEPDKEPTAQIITAPATIAPVETKGVKTYWKAELVDESQVPDTFTVDGIPQKLKTVNMTLIGQLVRKRDGNLGIPGIRCYKEERFSL